MLDQIREQSGHWLIKVALGVIVLVFIFWGFGVSKMGGGPDTYAAKVDGREIPLTSFEQKYRAREEQHRNQTKGMLPDEVSEKFITQQVMDGLVEEELLLEFADEAGIFVSPDEVAAAIKSFPEFTDKKTGQFIGREKYLAFFQERRGAIEVEDFERDISRSVRLEKTREFIQGSVKISPDEIHQEFQSRAEKLNLSYLLVDAASMTAAARSQPVTPAEIQAWTKDNPGKVESIYADQKSTRFTIPAKAELFQITIRKPGTAAKKATAEELTSAQRRSQRAQEAAQTDFAKAADQYAEATSWQKAGQSREFTRAALNSAVADKIFTMKPADPPALVETPTTWEIVKVKSTTPEKVTELDEAVTRTIVQEEITRARAAAAVDNFARDAFAQLKKGESLEKIAKAKDLQVKETGPFPHHDEIPGIADLDPAVITAAFKLSKGGVVELNGAPPKAGSAYLVAVVKEHTLPNEADFDMQKPTIEMSLRYSRQSAAFNAWKADRLAKAKIVENPRLSRG